MLDEKSEAILSAVNDLCGGGGFKIVDEEDLRRALSNGEGDVGKILSFLEEKKLIELRYAEEGTYCVRTMPAGRSYAERSRMEISEREKRRRDVLLYAALGSFLGSFVATALCVLAGVLLHV